MNLQQIVQIASILAGERLPDKTFTPESMTLLLKVASLKHFKRKLGLPEQYQPGMPVPQQVVEITQKNRQDLKPFVVLMGEYAGNPLHIDTTTGYADLPSDCYYISTISYKYVVNRISKPREVTLVTDTQWNDQVSSSLIAPSKEYPIANIQNGFIRFMPKTLRRVDFIYYRKPTDPVYAFEIKHGFTQFDEDNSVNFEWDEENQIDIIFLLLNDLSIPIEKPDVYKASEMVKRGGI